MSCPDRACASAAIVSISLSPCEVTKSIAISTFSLSAHSLQSLVMTSLAPGTQWSQKATLSLPAAWAPRTKGAAANAVVAIAAAPSTRRRVIVFSAILAFLEAGTLLEGGPGGDRLLHPCSPRPCGSTKPGAAGQKKTRGWDNGHGSRQRGCRIEESGAGGSAPAEALQFGRCPIHRLLDCFPLLGALGDHLRQGRLRVDLVGDLGRRLRIRDHHLHVAARRVIVDRPLRRLFCLPGLEI